MALILTGKGLTVASVVHAARNQTEIKISDDAWKRIKTCRDYMEDKLSQGLVMYGVNTGIGELAEVELTPAETIDFQTHLIHSHAAGVGEPLPIEVVRAALISRVNVHCNGNSGLRPEIVERLVELLNKGVTPYVPRRGSVGACGDLAPMAHMALVLMGEGRAYYQGDLLTGSEALKKADIEPVQFQARDGLAFINGSNVICGWSAILQRDIEKWALLSDIALALDLEVLNGRMISYDEKLHKARGFPGQIKSAANIRKLTEGSEMLYTSVLGPKKVQDAYSLRSTPQVTGTLRDSLDYLKSQLAIELNGSVDNPLFFPEHDAYIPGANFQGTPVAIPLEMVGVALTTASVVSERRVNRLLDPDLSRGLPAFLTNRAGFMSGLMIGQYTQAALVAENRVLANPAATGSIPAAGGQEDFVSMGMTTAIKTAQMLDNSWYILAIELISAAQAMDHRKPHKPGRGTGAAYEYIRSIVPFMERDMVVSDQAEKLKADIENSTGLLDAVKAEVEYLD